MSEQQAFDKYWHIETLTQSLPNGAEDVAKKAWQAATAEANKRINALEGEVANLHLNTKAQEQLGYELQASNNDLREALDMCSQICIDIADSDQINDDELSGVRMCEEAIDALIRNIKTPAESLQAHDDEVIEKCAKVCDGYIKATFFAHNIRALKEVK